MKNLKIKKKLILSFLIVVVLTAFVGSTGIYGINTIGKSLDDMYDNKSKPLGSLALAMEYFQCLRVQARNCIIFENDTDKLYSADIEMNDLFNKFEFAMAEFKPSISTELGDQLYTDIMSSYSLVKAGMTQLINDAKQGHNAEHLIDVMNSTGEAGNIVSSNLSELIKARMDVMETSNQKSLHTQTGLLYFIIAVIIISVCISMILANYISNLIAKPIKHMRYALSEIGTLGKLNFPPEDFSLATKYSKSSDEVGECVTMCLVMIRRLVSVGEALEMVSNYNLNIDIEPLSEVDSMGLSLQKMINNLNYIFGMINHSATQVAISSKQLSEGAESLAEGSTEQAVTVEEISSSIASISEETMENAKKTEQANMLANSIKQYAQQGTLKMNDMMDAVKDIHKSSLDISNGIKVIDDIVTQTNILSINATIESARVGQYGKGFSVVAEEVRNLANKCASAAKVISDLINNSIERSQLGVIIANETAASLAEVVSAIDESSIIISDIARSSEEQSAAIELINVSIDQVSQVVQENSAISEECSATSQELSGQAEILKEQIDQFKLRNSNK